MLAAVPAAAGGSHGSTLLRRLLAMRVRALVYQTHSWLGFIAGIFLVVISVSGVALLFRDGLDRAVNPGLVKVKVLGNRLPYDQLLESFSRQGPPGRMESLSLPLRREDSVIIGLDYQGSYHQAWMDPYTGRVLGYGGETASAAGWLDALHYRFLGGNGGEVWAGLVAIVLVLASATGIYIQGRLWVVLWRWPRARTRLRDSHNLIGSWVLLASIMFGLTGAWMCRFGLLRLLATEPATTTPNVTHVADRYLREAATIAEFSPTLVIYPEKQGDPVEVAGYKPLTKSNWFYGTSAYRLTMDAESGRIISRFDPTHASLFASVDDWFFALHSGQYVVTMPSALKLLYAVVGLSPAALAVSGYWLYLRRRGRNRRLRLPSGLSSAQNPVFTREQI